MKSGSFRRHFEDTHQTRPTKSEIIDNTSILTTAENRQKLCIKEALLILQHNPKINRQYDNFSNILKLYKSRNHTSTSFTQPNNNSSSSPQSSSQTPTTPIPTTPIPTTAHQVTPQITRRINLLISNSRSTPITNPPTIPQDSSISNRLRRSRRIRQAN